MLRKGAWFGPWQFQIQLENELFAVENVLSHPTSDHCKRLSDPNLDIALWLIEVVNPQKMHGFCPQKIQLPVGRPQGTPIPRAKVDLRGVM